MSVVNVPSSHSVHLRSDVFDPFVDMNVPAPHGDQPIHDCTLTWVAKVALAQGAHNLSVVRVTPTAL